jgi:Tol biopolymer transport system component
VGGAALLLFAAAAALWRWLLEIEFFWVNPLADAVTEPLTDFAGDELHPAISPDGKLAAFIYERDGVLDAMVTVIGTGKIINITEGKHPFQSSRTLRYVGFSDDREMWFLHNEKNGNTAYLTPAMGGEQRAFKEGASFAWSRTPDRRVVYQKAAPGEGDPLHVADADGSNDRKVFNEKPGIHCHFPIWSPDGEYIYFVKGIPATDELDIWRFKVPPPGKLAELEQITNHNNRVTTPDFLDSRTLIYSAIAEDGSGQWLYTMDVERHKPHRVRFGISEQYLSVAVSADGRRLVTTVATPSAELGIVALSGRVLDSADIVPFPVGVPRALAPCFARGYLLFLSSKGGGGADGLLKLENGATVPKELWKGSDGGVMAQAVVSPDGRWICFSFRKEHRTRLYIMNANNSKEIYGLADGLNVRGAASWDRDSNWVVVAGNQGNGTRVFKVKIDGSATEPLLDRLSYDPLWLPDDRILYSEQPQGGNQTSVQAITPKGESIKGFTPITLTGNPSVAYRFTPDGKSLLALESRAGTQSFVQVDLETTSRTVVAEFKAGSGSQIRTFDISLDGKQILFDRVQEKANIVFMKLPDRK